MQFRYAALVAVGMAVAVLVGVNVTMAGAGPEDAGDNGATTASAARDSFEPRIGERHERGLDNLRAQMFRGESRLMGREGWDTPAGSTAESFAAIQDVFDLISGYDGDRATPETGPATSTEDAPDPTSTPEETATREPSPGPTPEPTPRETATREPSPEPTPEETDEPESEPTPRETATREPSPEPTPEETDEPEPEPTPRETATREPSPEPTPEETEEPQLEPVRQSTGLVRHTSYESDPTEEESHTSTGHALGTTAEAVRTGDRAGFAMLKPGDPKWKQFGYRAEWHGMDHIDGPGTERWHGISYFFPDDWNQGSNSGTFDDRIIFQFTDEGSPMFSLHIDDDRQELWVRRKDPGGDFHTLGRWSFDTGRWYDITFHAEWTKGSDGVFEVYVDGEREVSYRGRTLAVRDVTYSKWGIYGQPTHLLFDEVRIAEGSNRMADVSP